MRLNIILMTNSNGGDQRTKNNLPLVPNRKIAFSPDEEIDEHLKVIRSSDQRNNKLSPPTPEEMARDEAEEWAGLSKFEDRQDAIWEMSEAE